MKETVVDLRKISDEDRNKAIELEKMLFKLNHTMPRTEEYMAALRDIFGDRFGEGSYIVAPLSAVCAHNILIGKNVYINSMYRLPVMCRYCPIIMIPTSGWY